MDKTTYQIADKTDSRKLTEFLCQDGQFLLPMVELITGAEMAIDELIEVTGRAAIEAVLTLSAQEVAGPKHPGKKAAGEIGWYGRQPTTIPLSERKLRVEKPRLRRKGAGADKEVAIPAYEAMVAHSHLGQRILEILMHGVSTRNYRKVLPQMNETVAVSKSHLRREFVEASEQTLKGLCERRFEGQDNPQSPPSAWDEQSSPLPNECPSRPPG
jgi:putative transposase